MENIKTKEEKKKAKFDVKEETKEELPQETVFDVFKGIREKVDDSKVLNEATPVEEEIVKEKRVDEWLKEIEKGLEYFREATMEKVHSAINKLRDEKDIKIEELKREMENQETSLKKQIEALNNKLQEKDADLQELKKKLNEIVSNLK
jgi:hypothetical protein